MGTWSFGLTRTKSISLFPFFATDEFFVLLLLWLGDPIVSFVPFVNWCGFPVVFEVNDSFDDDDVEPDFFFLYVYSKYI